MAIVEVVVPQLGEGLQEVRVIRFLKQPGDRVERDEHIYEMETDKANVEVESPYAGVIVEWLAKEGDILPIGAPIAK
ncbi:MAG: biotin/lipoyl-containing protein, partial [Fimbriimonadales bacterium]